jgi:thioredoxin-like negative regulator of GroEL
MKLFLTYFKVLIVFINFSLAAQDRLMDLAQQYVDNGEFEKALVVYSQLAVDKENQEKIFAGYYPLLIKYDRTKDAEKLLNQLIKSASDPIPYQIDLVLLHEKTIGLEKTEKEWSRFFQTLAKDPNETRRASSYLVQKNHPTRARDLFITSRKVTKQNTMYAAELGEVYMKTNDYQNGIDEFLTAMESEPENQEQYRNYLQNVLSTQEQMDILEINLIDKVQHHPNNTLYTDLLTWLYIQEKRFDKAFIQVRAIEKRNPEFRGTRLMELGGISFENSDFETALTIFLYVEKEFPGTVNYYIAKRYIIQTREEQVKHTYPIDQAKIRALIGDYKKLTDVASPNNPNVNESKINMAQLYAFYLDENDTAITLLEQVIASSTYDQRLKNKAKIHLGDIYLLKGEPWESTLIYSQVEKDMKEDPLGHEAKLRNAKLYYYKGEFELAQEQLDVLKMATSREISNDAIEMALLILDNTGLDTTTDAMQEYADIDLLIFRHHYAAALSKWLKYVVYRMIGNPIDALNELEKISASYALDIWGDDALFYTGDLYEKELQNSEKAMESYEKLLTNFAGSTYTVEARKRYRLLRGDKL